MSESYVSPSPYEPAADQTGKVDAAKQEASALKDTAASGAKQVVGTAKEEVKSVAGEAKSQVKDLYAQGKQQLADQAGTQQQRVATGLRSVGDELDSMASNSENGGVASDLVRNVSQRIGSAASWLEDRDPQSVLDDVKSYARRRPAVFIGGALVLGVVAGRLTRALASNASDDKSADTPEYAGLTTTPTYATGYSSPDLGSGYASGLGVDAVDTAPSGVYSGVGGDGYGSTDLQDTGIDSLSLDEAAATGATDGDIPGGAANVTDADGLTDADTPLYAQSTASWSDDQAGEGDDVRTDRV